MGLLGSLFKKGGAVKDPVCDMNVDPAKARWTSTHDGKMYYFCAEDCKEAFDADPSRYARA